MPNSQMDLQPPGKNNKPTVGIILLAAGASSRLGRPKQLLPYEGQTLLQHCLRVAMATKAPPIIVVLGANEDLIKNEITDNTAHIAVNKNWEEGMASSIRCGIQTLLTISHDAEGAILMVCDQPYVNSTLLNSLITAHKSTGKSIIASSYDNTFGPPVFFHRSLFSELLLLKGDVGARSIVRQHIDLAEIVPFPKGSYDVDTEADYKKIKTTGKF